MTYNVSSGTLNPQYRTKCIVECWLMSKTWLAVNVFYFLLLTGRQFTKIYSRPLAIRSRLRPRSQVWDPDLNICASVGAFRQLFFKVEVIYTAADNTFIWELCSVDTKEMAQQWQNTLSLFPAYVFYLFIYLLLRHVIVTFCFNWLFGLTVSKQTWWSLQDLSLNFYKMNWFESTCLNGIGEFISVTNHAVLQVLGELVCLFVCVCDRSCGGLILQLADGRS